MSLPPIGVIGPAILAGQVAGGAAIAIGRGFGQLLQAATGSQSEAATTTAKSSPATNLPTETHSLSQNFLLGDLRNFGAQLQERLSSLFGSSDEFQLRIHSDGQANLNAASSSQSVWSQTFEADGSLQDLIANISERLSKLGPNSSLSVTPSRIDIDSIRV